jgi:hypothetical protein
MTGFHPEQPSQTSALGIEDANVCSGRVANGEIRP